jgi:hypothetical protein
MKQINKSSNYSKDGRTKFSDEFVIGMENERTADFPIGVGCCH